MHRRTQKTSKHKKIKACDPFYTGPRKDHVFKADRYANRPPTASDGRQEVPRKFRDMMKAKETLKSDGLTMKAKRSRNKYAALNSNHTMDSRPEFKQGKYETQLNFFRRMDKVAQEAITKAELEVQFDVSLERTGKNKVTASSSKDPVALHILQRSTAKATTKAEPEIKRTKSQKRKEKLLEKAETRKAIDRDEFAEMQDNVAFGEVVMAPPQIKSAPRKAPKVKDAGDKQLLLRTQLFPEPEHETTPEKRSLFDALPDNVNASSIAAARQEVKRQTAVSAYRKLKKKRKTE